MKITIHNKKDLLEYLSKINGVVERRNTLQILSNVYLQVANNKLTIKATDLEISMETSLPVEMQSPGSITISAKNFYEIIKELPDKEIQISSKENNWVTIKCGSSNFNIMGIAPEDYPALPSFSESNFVGIDVTALKEMIDHTLFAVSTDETRYHMNGVFLDKKEGSRYLMVATDGHRLAYCEKELFTAKDTDLLSKSIIIPRKGVQELKKLLDSHTNELMVAHESNHLIFRTQQTYLFIRLIDGRFPDHKQVIPTHNPHKFVANTKAFMDSVRRVSLLANEKSRGIKLTVSEGRLEVSTNNPDLGEAKEALDVEYSGEHIEVGFNAKYLIDAIAGIESEELQFSLNDKMSPGLIEVPADKDYLCVLMPMRI